MNDFEALRRAVPDVGVCTAEVRHVALRVLLSDEGSVHADIEWVDDAGPTEIRIAIIERGRSGARVVQGLVFDALTGALNRAGDSVSTARPALDATDRADALAAAAASLQEASVYGPTAETKNAA